MTHSTVSTPAATAHKARSLKARLFADDGAATAEYVITTLAAVGLAGILVALLRGNAVKEMLTDIVKTALSFAG